MVLHNNNVGWVCPVCGKVYSPMIVMCVRCSAEEIAEDKTSEGKQDKDIESLE